MRKVLVLLTAAYTNGGQFITAGNSIPIGDEKLEITEERAKDMVPSGGSIEEVEDPADDEDADELGGKNVAELKAYATEFGIDLGNLTKKAEILAAIRTAIA
jgi:hypothetical protein